MRFPLYKVLNNKIIQYFDYEKSEYYPEDHINSVENLDKQKRTGVFKEKASKHLKNLLTLWITAIECTIQDRKLDKKYLYRYITFVTLTLSAPQKHTDQFIKRHMLAFFITQLKRKYHVKTYLWVAEAQKNGNIHFHICIDKPIHHQKIRDVWNSIQSSHGYLDNYEKIHGHTNANSTDIHGLKAINYIDQYICKYMTKTEDRRKIKGMIWGKSDNLLRLSAFKFTESVSNHTELNNLYNSSDSVTYITDHFSVIGVRNYYNFRRMAPLIYSQTVNHYSKELRNLRTIYLEKKPEDIMEKKKNPPKLSKKEDTGNASIVHKRIEFTEETRRCGL